MKIFIYLGISMLTTITCETLNASPSNRTMQRENGYKLSDKIQYDDLTYRDNIKTVEMYRSGWRLSPPMRNLRDTSSLILEFDDLNDPTTHYTYTLIHCSAEWQPSDLINTEYLSGLPENEIRDYRYSRNAHQTYKHYRLSLPNEDVQPKLPGNYILYVYENFDSEQPVLTRRFFIVDPLVQVMPDVHRTDNVKFLNTEQEVDFTVNYQALQPDDPRRNFKVALVQNLNWTTAITDLLPKYIQPGELVYNYEEENLFQGGSEFLHFDTKSLKYNSDRIREIRFQPPLNHVYLLPDRPKAFSSYEFQEDINGKFLVKWDDAFDSDTEADYVKVHFTLNTGDSIQGSDVYLFGGLTSWKTSTDNKCFYNPDNQSYEINMLFKQGYYNYSYAVRDRKNGKIDLTQINGNHYETENDYYILVYFRDIRERFDRLVGMQAANSVKLPQN
ncbi:MAG: DUF5103 domain-containing protein [Bacteroidales bacterium]|jgi:hypothetical protein